MSSYLNIYLQRKKKEGEEKGERLLLCSISRVNNIYSIFYENNIGKPVDDRFHEFTAEDLDPVIDDLTERISTTLIDIAHAKEMLPLLSEKNSIAETMDSLKSDKSYYQDLMSERTTIMTLGSLLADISESWCDFDKLYWKID